jgi:osmotically-inducible protein OsmY
MKTNEDLQADVQNAIKWEPLLRAAEIGVTAKNGVVSLTGTVDSYRKKVEAQDAAKNVAGVAVVIEDIKIKLPGYGSRNDSDIAIDVITAFNANTVIPKDVITVEVEDGWVTLGGEVNFYFQKRTALDALKNLRSLKGLSDCIQIREDLTSEVEETAIEQAINRNWSTKNTGIKVFAKGHDVTLSGTVNSYYQKDEAQRIVNNELVVEHDYFHVH